MYHEKIINIKVFLFNSIIFLMLINLILPGIKGSWSKIEYSYAYTYVYNYSSITSICLYLAFFLLYILLAICIYRHQKKGKIYLIITISILVFFIWSIISVFESDLKETFLSDNSINLCLIPLFYLLGYDETIYKSAKKIIPYIVVITLGLILWYSFSFILQFGISTDTRESPSKELFSVAISAYWCYALGMPERKGYHKPFVYMIGVCLLICAFIIRSRSWVIQCVLLLYIMIARSPGKMGLFRKIFSLFIVLLIFILIIYLFPNITGALFNRIGEDTRSGQYTTFFSQVKPISLLWGQGINAHYSFLGNTNYQYFDNQFIYIMFHYGIIPILCMLGIFSGLFKTIKKGNLNKDEKAFIVGCRLMSFFFLAALGGISVYFRLGWNVGTILIFVFIGRAHKLIRYQEVNNYRNKNFNTISQSYK